jgi:hypothetical protein
MLLKMRESTSTKKHPSDNEFTYVCKFREINEDFLNLLPNLEIYIPTVAQLNDPLEGVLTEGYLIRNEHLPTLEQDPTESQVNAYFSDLNAHKKSVTDYLQKVGIYSVSIHKRNWHASNFLPMWASYANNHKGVCMVFKQKPLHDERFKWVKVEYVTHRDNDRSEQPRRITPPTFTQDLFGNVQAKLSKKYDYWQHERELRLIAQPGYTGRQAMDQFFELHAMVFGFSAKNEDILKVLNQLPDEAKQKLMHAEDAGIYQVVKPDSDFMIRPLKNMRGLLKIA